MTEYKTIQVGKYLQVRGEYAKTKDGKVCVLSRGMVFCGEPCEDSNGEYND